MTPYYQRDGIQIFCGETLEAMAQLAGPFDAIIADLPYGTTACSWDTIIPFEPLWKQYKRLTAGAVVLFGSEPFSSLLRVSNLKDYKYDWIWNKVKPSGYANCKIIPMKQHEIISVFIDGKNKYNPQMTKKDKPRKAYGGKVTKENEHSFGVKPMTEHILNYSYPRSIINISNANFTNRLHPTQKPVDLLAYLIRTYTDAGEIVLDNTMGSGTTLVAAQREGRRAVGIEISEEYCAIAVERLRQPSFWSLPSETPTVERVEQQTLL